MDGGWDRPFYIRGHKLPVNSRLFLQLFRSTLLNKCHVNRSCPKTESAVQSTWNSRYRVFSDNSPQFACAEFRKLSNDWDFEHTTSSPRYRQSRGKVGNAVTGNMQDADEESRTVKDGHLSCFVCVSVLCGNQKHRRNRCQLRSTSEKT